MIERGTKRADATTAMASPSILRSPRRSFFAATAGVVLMHSAVAEATEDVTPKRSNEAAFVPHGSAYVDPLGFLLFGPTLGAELGLGQFSAMAYGRWFSAGVLSKAKFLDEGAKFGFSFGAGIKGRYYFQPGLVGPHVGIALEYLRTRGEIADDKIAILNDVLVPEIEAGYRLGLGRFYLGANAAIGYAYGMSQGIVNINGGDQAQYYRAEEIDSVYGSAGLDLGVLF
jgi:hypothetical protein